jgi:hypothetical protein
VKTYEKVRGKTVKSVCLGSVEDLERTANNARNEFGRNKLWDYAGYFYSLLTIREEKGLGNIDFKGFEGVKRTSLEDFLKKNPDI